jgi:RHS repeat-associated protein
LTFNSYERESSVDQKFKFQGQGHIDDLGLNWDSFKWRNHQPDIGWFLNVDPLAEKYVHNSPYTFSENKVTSHFELEGLESITIHGTRQGSTGPSFSKNAARELQRIGGNSKSDNSFRLSAPLNNREEDRKEAATALVSHVVRVRSEIIESGQIMAEEPVTLVGNLSYHLN